MSRGKYCKGCMRVKPPGHFYVNRKQKNALSTECKECTRRRARDNRLADIERYRAYDRERYSTDPKCIARLATVSKRWRKNNRVKARAHSAVAHAVEDGRLTKAPCEVCGARDVHGHHDDYSKPLQVRWLCAEHHKQWHDRNGPGLVPQENDQEQKTA